MADKIAVLGFALLLLACSAPDVSNADSGGPVAGSGGSSPPAPTDAGRPASVPTAGAPAPTAGDGAGSGSAPQAGSPAAGSGGVGVQVATAGSMATAGRAAPCPDADGDGICNAVDRCPMGPDADSDGNGYPDACERLLWKQLFTYNLTKQVVTPGIENARMALEIDAGSSCTIGRYLPARPETASLTAQGVALFAGSPACVLAFPLAQGQIVLYESTGAPRASFARADLTGLAAALSGHTVLYLRREQAYASDVQGADPTFNTFEFSGAWAAMGY